MHDSGPCCKFGIVCLSIIEAACGTYGVGLALDKRTAYYIGDMGAGIIIQCIGKKSVAVGVVDQYYIMEEFSSLRGWGVFSIYGGQGIGAVYEFSSVGIPSAFPCKIIVETIREEHYIPVFHLYLSLRWSASKQRHSGVAVVEEFVGEYEEGVALLHLHIAERIK